MAQRTGQGASTLSQAAAGERLPTLPVVLAYVRACKGDLREWEDRWHEAAAEEAAEPHTSDEEAEPPYRGLARFEPGDAELFFGRDELTERLLQQSRSRRFTAVFGPSGSGKSSLLRAGLIPRLRSAEATGPQPAAVRVLTPGEHPLRVHEQRLIAKDADGETWLIVDQFEEVYTLCTDPAERDQFIDRLLAATDPASRLRVVIAVRADFLGRCAEHPALTAALQDGTVLAGPMSRDELRETITKPAQAAGMIVERALTARILNEVEDEPGALPLMSHALLETWRRRKGRALTTQAYEAAGGLHGAIARTAENVHTQLTPSQADLARRILLRLITPGEGTPDTRRPAPRTELDFGDPDDTAQILEHLARARLLTLEHNTVDLAHEALIIAWPRLRAWINEARDRLRLHRQLTEAARAWDDLNRDPGALYRGTRLTAAEDAFATLDSANDLTTLEREFLNASTAAHDRETFAAARAARRLRQFAATLSVLLVLAVLAGLAAWNQYQISEQRQRQELTAHSSARSSQLAAESTGLLKTSPDLASLLAVQAYRTSPTSEAVSSLFTAAALPLEHRLTNAGTAVTLSFSGDGRTLAIGGDDGKVRLWSTTRGKLQTFVHQAGGMVTSVKFSPDGKTLASGGDDGRVRLWNMATGESRLLPGHLGAVDTIAFSPDGQTLTSDGDRTVRLWNLTTGKSRSVATPPGTDIQSVASSQDGRSLASGDLAGRVRLWHVTTGKSRLLDGHIGSVDSVAFSPDGRTLASGGDTGRVRLWNLTTGKSTTFGTGAHGVVAAEFSHDGQTLATGGGDGTVQLWDTANSQVRAELVGHTDTVTALAFSRDGRTLATGSNDGSVRLWETAAGKHLAFRHEVAGAVHPVAFSRDGRTLASGDDNAVRLWDVATGGSRLLGRHTAGVSAVAFSPDRHTLASGYDDGSVRLWDVFTKRFRTLTIRHPSTMDTVAFSPDGRMLATGGEDRMIRLWDLTTGRYRILAGNLGPVPSLVFSPDGRMIASGDIDGAIQLWDVATGTSRSVSVGDLNSGIQSVDFSPDGRTIASGGDDGRVRLWNMTTRKSRLLPGHASSVGTVAFSPDGRTLASGGDDAQVVLWNTATGNARTTFTRNSDAIQSLAWSPDGRSLAWGAADQTVQLWNVSLPDPTRSIRKICQALHRDLTYGERALYLPNGPASPPCSQ
ncbi:hypothetical protein ACFY0F_28995 [Streptomyces sp. NPDC001544]|uniref:nSTAND1 domain-containing NTPase n=1 Tax=Streptomyces sp. NPDC001544 TaxID=3364584 RepID=UPI0036C4E062